MAPRLQDKAAVAEPNHDAVHNRQSLTHLHDFPRERCYNAVWAFMPIQLAITSSETAGDVLIIDSRVHPSDCLQTRESASCDQLWPTRMSIHQTLILLLAI